MQNWANFAISDIHKFSTAGTVYDEPNEKYFKDYIEYTKSTYIDDVPDQFIPLNPPPVPKMADEDDPEFIKNFENATHYILYAAAACQRLRVDEEIGRRSKLRWYSVLADLYDRYKSCVNSMPQLATNRSVEQAVDIADDVKRDKKKRNALAKEVMAGRRINKMLEALRGQWHVIDLHDYITREFLVNNTQDFFNSLISGIRWPEIIYYLPYKQLVNSGSTFQYVLEIKEGSKRTREEEETIFQSAKKAKKRTSLPRHADDKLSEVKSFQIIVGEKFNLAVPKIYLGEENAGEKEMVPGIYLGDENAGEKEKDLVLPGI